MGFALSLLAALMFAGANVLSRRASRTYNGPDAISVSLSINVVLMVPLVAALAVIEDSTRYLHPWVLVMYAITGIFGSYLGRWFLYEGIRRVGPSSASLIKNSAPIFVVLLAVVLLAEFPDSTGMAAIVIILAGVWTLGAHSTLRTPTRGAGLDLAFPAIAAVSFAFADVVRAAAMDVERDLLAATAVSISAAWFAMLVVQRRRLTTHYALARAAPPPLVLASLLMGGAQLVLFAAVAELYVGYVTAIVATSPLWTALLSRFTAPTDESLGFRFWFAALAIVCGGVLLAVTN